MNRLSGRWVAYRSAATPGNVAGRLRAVFTPRSAEQDWLRSAKAGV